MRNKLSIQVAYDRQPGRWREAVRMMEEVMKEHDYDVGSFELIPVEEGEFKVRIDGEVVCSGQVPGDGEISDAVKARLSNDVGRQVRYNIFRFWRTALAVTRMNRKGVR